MNPASEWLVLAVMQLLPVRITLSSTARARFEDSRWPQGLNSRIMNLYLEHRNVPKDIAQDSIMHLEMCDLEGESILLARLAEPSLN